MYNSCILAFQSKKKNLLKGKNIHDCASDTLQFWLWYFLEALMQPGHPDISVMLTVFYILSPVWMEENNKLSLANDFKVLNWGLLDIIKGLDTNS